MSGGQPVSVVVARPVAEYLVEQLRSACDRIEIAGSIRRRKPMVADIEIVVMPRVEDQAGGDLWGTPVPVNLLTGPSGRLAHMYAHGVISLRNVESHRADGTTSTGYRDGVAYKALVYHDLPVDLFLVNDPDTWGTIFALRTGPGDWNTRLVTDCKRYLRRVEGAYVYHSGKRVPCPEERDFFEAIGQPWIEPHERELSRVHVQARMAVAS